MLKPLIIQRYVKENNLKFIKEYVDDGVSGTTFDRPGFCEMLQDIENQTINMIINTFRVFSDIDILKTTEYLNQFKNNLDWDSGFMLRLISFNFYEIINIETEQKQQLLYEIKKLIEKYKDIPDTENQIKIYD